MQWLMAVHRLAAAHVDALRDRWEARSPQNSVHAVVDEIVSATDEQWPTSVQQAADTARAAIATDHRWARLAALGLTVHEVEWLALLAACELNPRLTRVLGYLDDTAAPIPPSPALAAQLWNWPCGYQPGPASPLVHWQLAAPTDGYQSTTPWTIAPDVAAYLAGRDDWVDIRGDGPILDVSHLKCLHPALLDEMCCVASALESSGPEIELVGPTGSGRRTLLAQLAACLGRRVVIVDPKAGMPALRTAHLLDAAPLWIADPDEMVPVEAAAGLTLVARTAGVAAHDDRHVRLSWTMPPTHAEQREQLWAAATGAPTPRLVSDWDLTPAEVCSGAAAAAAGPAVASRVLRNRVRHGTLQSMSAVALPYDWDDLVRHPTGRNRTAAAAATRCCCAERCWTAGSFGVSCRPLLGSPRCSLVPAAPARRWPRRFSPAHWSSTCCVSIWPSVVSKYIGETEKQLAAVFAEAERSHVLVFFDEADALFGQRTKVHDAHDRYANIEIDYLLQRLETFRGVADPGDQPQKRPRRGVPAAAAHDHRLRAPGAAGAAAVMASGAAVAHLHRRADHRRPRPRVARRLARAHRRRDQSRSRCRRRSTRAAAAADHRAHRPGRVPPRDGQTRRGAARRAAHWRWASDRGLRSAEVVRTVTTPQSTTAPQTVTIGRLSLRPGALSEAEARRLAELVGLALGRIPLQPADSVALSIPSQTGKTVEQIADAVAARHRERSPDRRCRDDVSCAAPWSNSCPPTSIPIPNIIVFQYNPETMSHAWTQPDAPSAGPNETTANPLAVNGDPGRIVHLHAIAGRRRLDRRRHGQRRAGPGQRRLLPHRRAGDAALPRRRPPPAVCSER